MDTQVPNDAAQREQTVVSFITCSLCTTLPNTTRSPHPPNTLQDLGRLARKSPTSLHLCPECETLYQSEDDTLSRLTPDEARLLFKRAKPSKTLKRFAKRHNASYTPHIEALGRDLETLSQEPPALHDRLTFLVRAHLHHALMLRSERWETLRYDLLEHIQPATALTAATELLLLQHSTPPPHLEPLHRAATLSLEPPMHRHRAHLALLRGLNHEPLQDPTLSTLEHLAQSGEDLGGILTELLEAARPRRLKAEQQRSDRLLEIIRLYMGRDAERAELLSHRFPHARSGPEPGIYTELRQDIEHILP